MKKAFENETIREILLPFCKLYCDVFGYPAETLGYLPERIEEAIEARLHPFVLCEMQEEEILGAVFGYRFERGNWWAQRIHPYLTDHSLYQNSFELNDIFVQASQQSQGIGRELLLELERCLPYDAILLSTPNRPENRAFNFYQKLGYEVLSDQVDLGLEEGFFYYLMVKRIRRTDAPEG